jgi:hypothetical protein
MQNRTDTAPIPALIVQFDHLEAGLVAVWMAVIGVQGQGYSVFGEGLQIKPKTS